MTQNEISEPEWPTHCPTCGTPLESEVIESAVTNDWNRGTPMTVLAHDVCPNPDCPARGMEPAEVPGSDTFES